MDLTDATPSRLRRLAALFYDSMLIIALMMVFTAFALMLNEGNAVADKLSYQFGLLAIILFFYVGFWHSKGQTLGMAAWKLRVVDIESGKPISIRQGLIRLLVSLSLNAITFVWPQSQVLPQDRLSGSRLIRY